MTLDLKLPELINWLQRNAGKQIALVVVVPLGTAIGLSLAKALSFGTYGALTFAFSGAFIAVGWWLWFRRMPKTARGKVGFAVAIHCESSVRPDVRKDFVSALRASLNAGPTASTFDFIEVPDHFAAKAFDKKDAERIRQKARAHFLLLGEVRTRLIQGQEHDVLKILALVRHAPTSKEVSAQVNREFAELLPTEARIPTNESYLLLEFTAAWAATVAKYIIGIAAAISRDLDYAEKLFKEVAVTVSARDTGFLVYAKLKERVPTYLAAIADVRADASRYAWLQSHEPKQLDQFLRMHDEARQQPVRNAAFWSREAMSLFLEKRDVQGASRALSKVPKKGRDAIWHLNHAFLCAYRGNLTKATEHYERAAKLGVPSAKVDVVVGQVEPFIGAVLQDEPDKVQLFYCLGFLNWQFKGDLDQAIGDLSTFITKCPADAFQAEIAIAKQWITEIESSR